MFIDILQRELRILLKCRAEIIVLGLLFIMFISLFPINLQHNINMLELTAQIAPAVIWVGMFTIMTLALDKQFRNDYDLEIWQQIILGQYQLELVILAKICAQVLFIGLPLIIFVPIASLLLNITFKSMLIAIITMLVGIPGLCALGTIVAVLTVGLRNSGILLALLLIPLYLPVLIFATSAIANFNQALPYYGQLAILLAISIGSIMLAPFIAAQGIKLSVSATC